MRKWTTDEILFLRNYYPELPTKQIATSLGRSVYGIRIKAKKLGIKKKKLTWDRTASRWWTPEQERYLIQYYPTARTRDIANALGKTSLAVRIKANKLGFIKKIRHGHIHLSYAINEDAFKLIDERIAYVVGLILADGCIKSTALHISNTDLTILEKIKTVIGSSHPIRLETRGKYSWYTLTIVNPRLVADVIELGITPRKSLTAHVPRIPDTHFFDFLRGYFDGDGSSRLYKGCLYLKFTSGSYTLLEGIALKIHQLLGIPAPQIVHDKGRPTANRLYYFGSNALAIGRRMYQNAADLYIPRKRQAFEQYAIRRGTNFPMP